MSIHPLLRLRLEPLARRRQRQRLWFMLAGCWALASVIGLGLMALQDVLGWSSWLALPMAAGLGLVPAAIVLSRARHEQPNWRSLARQIESKHPELDGRLLTAVEQEVPGNERLGYLQQRLLEEALAHDRRVNWGALLPRSRVWVAQTTHLSALAILAVVLWGLRVPGSHGLLVPRSELGVTVTPGDVTLEQGSSLLVMARFEGRLPAKVELILDQAPGTTRRFPLVKSLADPLFGTTVPEVNSNLFYHLEYAGLRTRDFKVTVFEYPRLERADADITYPGYTGQKPKHIDNTRRVSAVEGSRLDLALVLNKTVSRVGLIPKDKKGATLSLLVETNRPLAALRGFALEKTETYALQLVDSEGRTNKVPAQFVFDALKNRAPEMKMASPSGDTRPSALEEIAFDGTVWDDFGVQAYGLAYSVPGKEPKVIELGRNVPAKEKRPFHFLLHLEELGVQPDDLLSWFVWAEDIGPDGRMRRTSGDLFFGEVRPFDEVFRQGASMAGGAGQEQQEQSEGAGGQAGQLADLQKQIINATWKLFRQQGASLDAFKPGFPPESGGNTNSPSPSNRSQQSSRFREAAPFSAMGLAAADEEPVTPRRPSGPSIPGSRRSTSRPISADDLGVVSDAQSQALDQAEAARQRQQDPRTAALWEAATRQMERAVEKLKNAKGSFQEFKEALAAEQAAYQALLKLQEHEYSVSRNRNRQSGQSSRQQQMQRQLDQLDLTESDNRYETERQARSPQSAERREQLQVMNRLQELARRQQDVNERLKELQTALQEARTESEREEIRRQLKRLEEEEQQLLADADELRQRMDRTENQSRMSEQRRQLDQARNDLQRAAEATQQGQPSQALAAGTRAQRQLQDMRDELRRQSAGEFDEELRQMRAEARELARRQEDVQKQMEQLNDRARRTLSDTDLNRQASELLARQRERLTNLVQSATQLSQDAEPAEPLMSRELYDTLRKFTQDDSSTLKQFQEELMNRGMTSRDLYERLKRTEQSGAKSLDLTSEMLRQGFLPEAGLAEERARAGINDLKRGVERAAESVLGDDTESLRLAGQELDRLAEQLEREIAQSEGGNTNVQRQLSGAGGQQANDTDRQKAGQQGQSAEQTQAADGSDRSVEPSERSGQLAQTGDRQGQTEQGRNGTQSERQPETAGQGQEQASTQERGQGQNAQSGNGRELASNQQSQSRSSGQDAQQPSAQNGRGARLRDTSRSGAAGGANRTERTETGGRTGQNSLDIDRLFDGRGGQWGGPITGEDFAPWSDGLRNVEELVDTPSLRNEVASARERARRMRQDYTRHQQKPDWAVVRLQVLKPLVEVRNEITEELARREHREDLVPIDRDPVPGRYSELVRRYYEELGKDPGARANSGTNPPN